MAVYLEDRLLDAIELAGDDGYELLCDGLRDAADRVEEGRLKWSILWAAVKAIIGERVYVHKPKGHWYEVSNEWDRPPTRVWEPPAIASWERFGWQWTNDCDFATAESILAAAR